MDKISSKNDTSILTCALCKQKCKVPKVLPCLHSCCAHCYETVSSLLQSVRCRVCLEDVDSSAFSTLPDNIRYHEVQMSASDDPLQEDTDFFGKYSVAAPYETYKVNPEGSVGHLPNGDDILRYSADLSRQDGCTKVKKTGESSIKCQEHPIEKLRYFCYSCEEAICSECLISKHKKHDLVKIEECCDRYRAKLAMLDNKVQERAISINESLNHISFLQQRLSHNADNAKENIQNEIRRLRAKLDRAEEEMMLEIDKEANRKAFLLKKQEQQLKLAVEKFATASSFMNKTVSFASDVEVTLIRKFIHNRVKDLEDIHVETKPKCNDKISQDDLRLKLELILAE